jgi:plasmid stabilization system protein ParE
VIAEARAAREWYQERSPAAANAFMKELDHAIEQIAKFPGRWPTFRHGTRRFLLGRFPFSVVYWEGQQSIEIVAIAHARRRPGYWKARI